MTFRVLLGLIVLFFLTCAGTYVALWSIYGGQHSSVQPLTRSESPIVSLDPASANKKTTPTPAPVVKLMFVGDMMFDRHIRQNAQKRGGYDVLLSPKIKKLFAGADLVIGNLEGPVTRNPSKSVGSVVGSPANYLFTFDPTVVPFLYKHNIRMVNLGNNHILNFGQSGLEETYSELDRGGVAYFGATGRTEPQQRWSKKSIAGVEFAFVNYNQFTPDGLAQTLEDLKTVRANHDVVILYTHWGNEYVPENAVLKQQARQLIGAGADLIIGSHPHVVTGVEDIGGKRVYYSLGNFIFDQYFETAVKNGLMVSAEYDVNTKQFAFTEHPVRLETNGTTALKDEVLAPITLE